MNLPSLMVLQFTVTFSILQWPRETHAMKHSSLRNCYWSDDWTRSRVSLLFSFHPVGYYITTTEVFDLSKKKNKKYQESAPIVKVHEIVYSIKAWEIWTKWTQTFEKHLGESISNISNNHMFHNITIQVYFIRSNKTIRTNNS